MLKYYNYDIVFQEVPDETSLAINLTNCPNHCNGCHSPHLWEDTGAELTEQELDRLAEIYKGDITCICIMGGDAAKHEVENLARHIKHDLRLKMAWYSGRYDKPSNIEDFDYIKFGPYIPEKGGLKSPDTNQRFYKVVDGELIDKTERFQRKH
ncbi:MAG: anaerobic ribonucleoside-triphosphate reductase activating protein [Bacteroidales bacterium]|nr:anaerobic ribonucleoside-triphosphate reductase activating protein [Bacteroidales bacterium]